MIDVVGLVGMHVIHCYVVGRGAPKVALRFTSGVEGVPQLASAEAFVEFEKEVRTKLSLSIKATGISDS